MAQVTDSEGVSLAQISSAGAFPEHLAGLVPWECAAQFSVGALEESSTLAGRAARHLSESFGLCLLDD